MGIVNVGKHQVVKVLMDEIKKVVPVARLDLFTISVEKDIQKRKAQRSTININVFNVMAIGVVQDTQNRIPPPSVANDISIVKAYPAKLEVAIYASKRRTAQR